MTCKHFTVLVVLLGALVGAVSTGRAQGFEEGRPAIPNAEVYESPHFIVHYTRSGSIAVPAADDDADDIPD